MLTKTKVKDTDGLSTVTKYKKDGTLKRKKRTGLVFGKRY